MNNLKILLLLFSFIVIHATGQANHQSCHFNGSTDSIVIGSLGTCPDSGSISFLFRWDGTYPGGYPNIFSTNFGTATLSNSTVNTGISFQVYSGLVVLFSDGANFQFHNFFPSNNLQPNTNYHIALVWNKSNQQVKGYLNGILIFNEANYYWPTHFTNVVLGVGSTADRLWPGTIDDISFWRKELSIEEIYQHIHSEIDMNDPYLNAYYSFDGNVVNGSSQTIPNEAVITSGLYTGNTFGTASTPSFQNQSYTSNSAPQLNVASTNFCSGNMVAFHAVTGVNGSNSMYQFRLNGNLVQVGNSNQYQTNNLQDLDVLTCDEWNNIPYTTPTVISSNALTMHLNCNDVTTCQKPSTTEEMLTLYENDFNSASLGSATLTQGGPTYAGIANGKLNLLKTGTQGLRPQLVIPASGMHSNHYHISFDIHADNATADGFSYSFGIQDNDSLGMEMGNFNQLKVGFVIWPNNWTPGIHVSYGASVNNLQSFYLFNPNIIQTSYNTTWANGDSHIDIDINEEGQLTLTLNNSIIFNHVNLPLAYKLADRTHWVHAISARTGTYTMNLNMNNLLIQQANNKTHYMIGDTVHLFSTAQNLLNPTVPVEWRYDMGFGWLGIGNTNHAISFVPPVIGQYIFEAKVTFLNGDYCTKYDTIFVDSLKLFEDADADGFGNPLSILYTSGWTPNGYVLNGLDCDDTNPFINPSATEICGNGLDDDCNGLIDDLCTPANAMNFDGVNDYISLPNGGGLNGLQTGTIEMMVKWNGTYQVGGPTAVYGAICGRQSNGYFSNQIIGLDGPDPNTAHIIWRPYNWVTAGLISYGFNPHNTWHHVAVTYTNGTHKLYVDGNLVDSASVNGMMESASAPFTLGAWIGDGNSYANADLDEVRVWDTVRTKSELMTFMNCQMGLPQNHLLHLYHFNQGNSGANNSIINMLQDEVGTEDGVVNAALQGPSSNWIESSPVNSLINCSTDSANTLVLDGMDDVVELNHWGSAPTTGTISFFVKPAFDTNDPNAFSTHNAYNKGFRFENSLSQGFNFIAGDETGNSYQVYNLIPATNMNFYQWYHIAISWDQTQHNVVGYVDGVEVFNTNHYDWPTTWPDVTLGGGYDPGRTWTGWLDEIAIYHEQLSSSEIVMLGTQQPCITDIRLWSYYDCHQGLANGNNQSITQLVDAKQLHPGLLSGFSLSGSNSNFTNSNLTILPSGCSSDITLNLKCFIQGYYIGNTTMNSVLFNQTYGAYADSITDFVIVELHYDNSPFVLAYSIGAYVSTHGLLTCTFPSSVLGNAYYIVIKYRNAVYTWSASPVTISNNLLYDFSTAISQAYGDNQVEVEPGVWALYSGDVNQDWAIDAFDYLVMEPDIINGSFGYYDSDLNGDGSVDAFDYLVLEGNIIHGIGAAQP